MAGSVVTMACTTYFIAQLIGRIFAFQCDGLQSPTPGNVRCRSRFHSLATHKAHEHAHARSLRSEPIVLAAAAVAAIGLAAILGAYFFQYVLGYRPCPLCLEQRIAYYIAIPLAAMVLLGVTVSSSRKVMTLAFLAIAAAMLWNAGLGAYHAGIEWHWWEGPKDCSGPIGNFGPAGGSPI